MNGQPNPRQIVDQMLTKDAFSQWLGIVRIAEGDGYASLKMTTRVDMLNGFGIVHGGITFSFADSAFAFASNSRGKLAVSVETSISHVAPAYAGDVLIATATEQHLSRSLGRYVVEVKKEDGSLIALFKGTVFRKKEDWKVK